MRDTANIRSKWLSWLSAIMLIWRSQVQVSLKSFFLCSIHKFVFSIFFVLAYQIFMQILPKNGCNDYKKLKGKHLPKICNFFSYQVLSFNTSQVLKSLVWFLLFIGKSKPISYILTFIVWYHVFVALYRWSLYSTGRVIPHQSPLVISQSIGYRNVRKLSMATSSEISVWNR